MKPYVYAIIAVVLIVGGILASDLIPFKYKGSNEPLEKLQVLVDNGKVEQARSLALSLVKENPDNAQVYNFLGNIELLRNELKKAEEYYLNAVAIEPENADFYSNLGVLYSNDSQPQKAFEHFLLATEYAPNHAIALYNLGNLALASGQVEQAKIYFIKTITADALHSGAHYKLAAYYRSNNDDENALRAYQSAIQANPDNVDARIDLGNMLQQAGDLQSAQEQLSAAKKVSPNSPRLLYALATLFTEQENFALAIEQYQTAIELQDDIPSYYVDLAYAIVYLGQEGASQQAESWLQKAIALSPNDGRTNYLTAVFYDKHGFPEMAIPYYEKAVLSQYKALSAMLYAAESYLKTGDKAKADLLLEQLLNIPDISDNLRIKAQQLLESS